MAKPMARRKAAEQAHAMPCTQKKKRKTLEEEPIEVKTGPSGWEELEAVEAPKQEQGKFSVPAASLYNFIFPASHNMQPIHDSFIYIS